jgi:hypothetical protein
VNEEAAKDRRCADSVDLQGAGLVCAVPDDLVIALNVTVDELVGLAGAGLPALGSRPGISLRSEVLAEVANAPSDWGASSPPR